MKIARIVAFALASLLLSVSSSGAGALRPLAFEENRGQTAAEVRFLARGPGYGVFLTPSEAVLTPRGSGALRLRWLGARPALGVFGEEELPGRSHYLLGDDPAQWRTGIPSWTRVRYRGVYPGIDLIFYGNPRQLEYDFVVAPGADPRAIRLAVQGADHPAIDAAGDLVLGPADGGVRLRKPVAYQEIGGARRAVPARWRLARGRAGFVLGAYDSAWPLVIDPVLTVSTYLGGGSSNYYLGPFDEARAVAVDPAGNAYVAGRTYSFDFPLVHPLPPEFHGDLAQAFVAKLSPSGALLWSTMLGGKYGPNDANAVAVDAAGHAYVTGRTDAPDFPLVHPLPAQFLGGGGEIFVSKLAADGASLVYSTRLGGYDIDEGLGIAVDHAGSAWVVGETLSPDFPLVHPLQEFDNSEGFVAKLSPSGSSLLLCTPFGGESGDWATGVAVDAAGNALVTGWTGSENFPVLNAFQPVYGGGGQDAFVAKLSAAGALLWSTYLGGSGPDEGAGIAADAAGRAVVTGRTFSFDFPVRAAVQPVHQGFFDAFVTRLDAAGFLVSSTFLGGDFVDEGRAVSIDPGGGVHVTGWTASPEFPVVQPLHRCAVSRPPFCLSNEIFVTSYDPEISRMVFSTYLGGSGQEAGQGIAADRQGGLWVAGGTDSADFPTVRAVQPALAGGTDAFVLRLAGNRPPDCAAAAASPASVWPPNGKLVPVAVLGVTDPDGEPVTLRVTAVSQDEPLSKKGQPDATGLGTAAPLLRADRAGGGDGRVYHVTFTATDPQGAACTGAVTVCVPHDQSHFQCGDGGPLFDALR